MNFKKRKELDLMKLKALFSFISPLLYPSIPCKFTGPISKPSFTLSNAIHPKYYIHPNLNI